MMSVWVLIGTAVAGICFIVGLGLYLTHGLDEDGEPLEYRE